MNSTAFKRTSGLKCGSAIKLLSTIALVCTVLSHVSYFFTYRLALDESVYELTFRIPHFERLVYLLITLVPCVLLVIYIFKFYKKLKATILIPIIFGMFSLEMLIRLFVGISDGIRLLIDLLILVACIFAIISALKGLNNKLFVIIAMLLFLLREVFFIIDFFSIIEYYIEDSMYFYVFTSPLSTIGSTLLYISLLLFSVKNRIPSIIVLSPEKEKSRVEKMDPEQALKLLKDKLELGMITEEEYQEQRADVISKL